MNNVVECITVPHRGRIACVPPHRDSTRADLAAQADFPQPGLWQQFSYNDAGDLLYRGKRVLDWVEQYDAPLSIIDADWVRIRTRQLEVLLQRARAETNYYADTEIYYAAKARMHAGVVLPAYQAGALGETSSVQDLLNLEMLWRNKLLPRNFSIISNGFKLPPERLMDRSVRRKNVLMDDYASTIMRLHLRGLSITPILDSVEEVEWFSEYAPRKGMDVGVRLAFGKISALQDVSLVASGFGLTMGQARKALAQLAQASAIDPTHGACHGQRRRDKPDRHAGRRRTFGRARLLRIQTHRTHARSTKPGRRVTNVWRRLRSLVTHHPDHAGGARRGPQSRLPRRCRADSGVGAGQPGRGRKHVQYLSGAGHQDAGHGEFCAAAVRHHRWLFHRVGHRWLAARSRLPDLACKHGASTLRIPCGCAALPAIRWMCGRPTDLRREAGYDSRCQARTESCT